MKRFTKLSIIIAVLCCISLRVYADEKKIPSFDTYHKNVYGNLFGPNILIGINYDMRFTKGQLDGIGFRVGLGGVSIDGTSTTVENGRNDVTLGIITIPLEFNYLTGKRRSHFLAGVGLLPAYVYGSIEGDLTDNDFVDAEGFAIAGVYANIGYRYAPLTNGFMFEIAWTPMFLRGGEILTTWGSIGIGYGFK